VRFQLKNSRIVRHNPLTNLNFDLSQVFDSRAKLISFIIAFQESFMNQILKLLLILGVLGFGQSALAKQTPSRYFDAFKNRQPITGQNVPLNLTAEPLRSSSFAANPLAGVMNLRAAANSWTILVYVNADNSLEENARSDIDEMMKVGSNQNVKMFVQVDFKSLNGVARALMTKGGVTDAEELPELNSDDPQNLANFIAYGIQKYPAQHYGLVLWDHGGQWFGYGGDETNDGSGMSLPEVHTAVSAALRYVGIPQLDILSFDTCLMGGLEPVLEEADLAKLYIANPEIDYGDGWDYAAVLDYLEQNPSSNLNDFARSEVKSFTAHHNSSPSDLQYRAHVAYDTTKVANLTTAVQNFNAALQTAWESERNTLAGVRKKVLEYGIDPEDPHAPRDFIDLGDYATLIATSTKNIALKLMAGRLSDAIAATVIAKTTGSRNGRSSGLSVYLPSNSSSLLASRGVQAYNALRSSGQTNWKDFVQTWSDAVRFNRDRPELSITSTENSEAVAKGSPTKIKFSVKGEDVDTFHLSAGQALAGGYNLYGDLAYTKQDAGEYSFRWDGGWYVVSDGTKIDYFCGFYNNADEPQMISNAIYTAPNGQKLEVGIVFDEENSRITSALDLSGSSPRDINLEPGGRIGFEFIRLDASGNEQKVPTGLSVNIPKEGLTALEVEWKPLPKGTYSISIGATDWAGNEGVKNVPVTVK
jgi:Clostripain family